MLAARLSTLPGALQAPPLSALLVPLLPALSQLQQRLSFATHGVADGSAGRDGVPRFYKTVHVKEALDRGGYQVMLDQRVLRTPGRHPLIVPSRALALAIAAEWEWQLKRIQPFTMPLMSLAATAIDQPKHREDVIRSMLQYLPTDTVLCRDEPGPLAQRQAEIHDPVLRWARGALGVDLEPTESIFGAQLGQEQLGAVRRYLEGLDSWHLAAAEQLAGSCKSVLLGLAGAAQQLGVEAALAAARLEEDKQIEEWGLVEGGHDIDIADLRVRIAAPSLFLRLLRRH